MPLGQRPIRLLGGVEFEELVDLFHVDATCLRLFVGFRAPCGLKAFPNQISPLQRIMHALIYK